MARDQDRFNALLTAISNKSYSPKRLDLSKAKLTHTDIVRLMNALATNKSIIELCLSFNTINADAARVIATNTTITSLDLSHCMVDSDGMKALAENTGLIYVDLSFNLKMEDSGILEPGQAAQIQKMIVSKEICFNFHRFALAATHSYKREGEHNNLTLGNLPQLPIDIVNKISEFIQPLSAPKPRTIQKATATSDDQSEQPRKLTPYFACLG